MLNRAKELEKEGMKRIYSQLGVSTANELQRMPE